jgi:hypothetical protein
MPESLFAVTDGLEELHAQLCGISLATDEMFHKEDFGGVD